MPREADRGIECGPHFRVRSLIKLAITAKLYAFHLLTRSINGASTWQALSDTLAPLLHTLAQETALCLRIFCRIHSPSCHVWIAFSEKKEFMMDFSIFCRISAERFSPAFEPSQSSDQFSQPHLVPFPDS